MQKKSVNICSVLYIFSVFVHIQSLEPNSCCSHAKLLCSWGPVPLTWVVTFLALMHLPWSSFPASTMNRKKHLLHISLLNGTDRMVLDLLNGYCLWQAEGAKNLHLLYCPLHSYSMVPLPTLLVTESCGGQQKAAQFSKVLIIKRGYSWELTDCWWDCEAGATFFIEGPSLDHGLLKYLTHFSASQRQISPSSFKIKALSGFVDLPDCT